jgi:hypothetical protein
VVQVADEGRGMIPHVDGSSILARPDRPGVVVRMHFNLAAKPETYR